MSATVKQPANMTNQVELLYRDIKIMLEEVSELRPYKTAIEELEQLAEANSYSEELQEVLRIITKHIKKEPAALGS